ncbi:DUF4384 domain-containing protein [Deinococcus sp. Leaf326]|uniref:DUF4384 domain-containing protein n=1 Tax=Deinococcus sp. Leaf326 TaxID=1736338 RepID=UPI0009E90D4F|nr:DUF4384 domain-containing protein [Deinococcus sp. Leaf326]
MRMLSWAVLALGVGLTACGNDPVPVAGKPRVELGLSPSPVRAGESLTFLLTLSGTPAPWNVALFVENPDGGVQQLMPNRLSTSPLTLTPGAPQQFPGTGAGFELKAGEPLGTHTALLFAAPAPLNLDGISAYASAQAAFATVLPAGQGRGLLETSVLTRLRTLNPGVSTLLRFDVTR